MRREAPLPADIGQRLATLGATLGADPNVRFAYIFGSAGRGELRPLSDVDVAVYLDDTVDPVCARLDVIGMVTRHLGTDEVDLVVLNVAPTALVGRILGSRRIITDKDPFLRHRFESLAIRKFLDFRIFERRFLDARFTRVDRDLLRRKVAELTEYVTQVSEYHDLTVERYRADWKTQRIVERTLQMAIEVCLDVASHIVADRALPAPFTYGETFETLVPAGLLSPGLGRVMVEMTGFRNIGAHEYARIDAEVVVRILRDHLDDFGRFEAEVLRSV